MPRAASTAVVTGAARGIGLAVARRLAGNGYVVYLVDHDRARGERAAPLVDGGRLRTLDVTDEACVASLFQEVERDHGELDLLVNNAAVSEPANPPVEAMQPWDWHQRLTANLSSAYLCTHFGVELLRARSGSIVNIASTRAQQSEPHCEAYAAAKGGLIALTHALAISLGPDVRVNAVSPGWIDTSASASDDAPRPDELTPADHAQHPVGRVGSAEDVAQAVAWLASPAAAFMTGQNLVLDGGMTRRMIYAD